MPSKQRQNPSTDRVMSAEALREVGFDGEGNAVHAYEVPGGQRGGRGTATISAFLAAGRRR